MIRDADIVYIVGLRRSFPVAAYLAYALRHVDNKRACLIDGSAGMLAEQAGMLRKTDLLIATSFRPYAKETAEIVTRAREVGARIIAISDSRLSPIARDADIAFEIKDAEVRQFRSLTAFPDARADARHQLRLSRCGPPRAKEPLTMPAFALSGAGRIARSMRATSWNIPT